jgi:TetR/AcrR family transcriptional regulator
MRRPDADRPAAPAAAGPNATARLRRRRKPARRDPELSKALILSAARDEFVEHGLNGARVDSIARRTGSGKNLIYHYFGNKEQLYLAVLEEIYREMRAHQDDEAVRHLPPLDGMRLLVANTFDYFVRTPALTRLMSIENIHYAKHLKTSKTVRSLYDPLLETLRIVLARGQAAGAFRRDVEPIDLYISISALAYFYLSNRHTLSWIFRQDLAEPQRLAQRRQHVVDMIIGYLCFGSAAPRT